MHMELALPHTTFLILLLQINMNKTKNKSNHSFGPLSRSTNPMHAFDLSISHKRYVHAFCTLRTDLSSIPSVHKHLIILSTASAWTESSVDKLGIWSGSPHIPCSTCGHTQMPSPWHWSGRLGTLDPLLVTVGRRQRWRRRCLPSSAMAASPPPTAAAAEQA
jgi:hypothetical protein